jgi:hypothetical protein
MVRPIKQITSKGRPFSEHVSSDASVGRPGKRPGQKQASEPITEKSSRRRSEAALRTMQWFQRGLPQTSWPAMRSGRGNRVNDGRIPGRGGGVQQASDGAVRRQAKGPDPIGPLACRRLRSRSACGDPAGVGIEVFGSGLVLLRRGSDEPTPSGLLETIAVAVHGQDADVVGEPVEQRAGQPFRSQDRGTVLEGQVRGDDGRARRSPCWTDLSVWPTV